VDPDGRHSWATRILPYLNYAPDNQLDTEKPWSHPDNRKAFGAVIPEFINPELGRLDSVRKEGWGLNHYALNSAVMESNARWIGGGSNTLMIGETTGNFHPWGEPGNWRDPLPGINTSPYGFGGPSGKGAYFIMADGSVRFISKDIDASVLRQLAE